MTLASPYAARHHRRRLYAERERLRATGNTNFDGLSFIIREGLQLWIIPRQVVSPPASVGFTTCRPIHPDELPERILSRGKSRVGLVVGDYIS